jgi:hypothetical protein
MTDERWKRLKEFPGYSVSDNGRVRADKSGRILALSENQFGVVCVGMMKDGEQKHRSVPLLVAKAFVKGRSDIFDTPINLDGNRWNNHYTNLVWRPRWFAIKYNRQFREPYVHPILLPLQDVKTGEITVTSFKTAKRYGLLESDVVLSIANRTVCWPTYQEFRVVED